MFYIIKPIVILLKENHSKYKNFFNFFIFFTKGEKLSKLTLPSWKMLLRTLCSFGG